MASHMIEHYEYTQDMTFLARRAYPVLKQSAEFFLDYMTVQSESGYLVTGPSVSPENSFFTDDSASGEQQLSLAPTLDIVLVRDLFKFCVHAADQLKTDRDFAQRIQAALAKLPPLKVGKRGQLQEWLEDHVEAQPDHRHLSHTMALCRSDQITPRHSPNLADAVKITVANRQSRADLEDIEFTAALFGLIFARLNDAENSLKQIGHLIADLSFDNLLSYSKAGVAGAETSIFVIDGNYGGAAVVAEMLLRSSVTEIDLLPALPAGWCTGSVQGLRARGNVEVGLKWDGGELSEARLEAFSLGNTTVYYKAHSTKIFFKPGDVVKLGSSLQVIE